MDPKAKIYKHVANQLPASVALINRHERDVHTRKAFVELLDGVTIEVEVTSNESNRNQEITFGIVMNGRRIMTKPILLVG